MNNRSQPQESEIAVSLGKVAYTLDKAYIPQLRADYSVFPFDKYTKHVTDNKGELEIKSNIRALQVSRWVYDKEELIRDGFKNVLGLFAGGKHNIALVIRRTATNTEVYFIVKNELCQGVKEADTNIALLKSSLAGNFCGSEADILIKPENVEEGINRLSSLLDFDKTNAISVLCGIPSEKSEDYVSQGIDRLLNGIVPKDDNESYTVVILAQPMTVIDLRGILSEYEAIASSLSPFAEKQIQFGTSKTDTKGENKSDAHTTGKAYTETKMKNVNVNISGNFGVVTVGGGFGYSWGNAITNTINDTTTVGTSDSLSEGETENTSFTDKSYMVSGLIEKLEATIKRINESQSTGLWRTAAYVLSASPEVSRSAANFLNSIMQGELSYLEPSFIQTWYKNDKDDGYTNIIQYVKHMTHPVFKNKKDGNTVLPTANVSTTELSNLFAFPRFSVQGLPILECVRFGRDPHGLIPLEKDVEIGNGYHMRHHESTRIFLDKKELTKHTFITGSTGSGKSNAIYTILNKLCPNESVDTTFLVIEPAKGEYKDVFGGRNDVTTYGTNPFKAPNLLKINPFSFPDEIHVLEHVDRLVEVFNACWPMYAAMPAILKEAVEKSYERVGWNLKLSKNPGSYPDFLTLMSILPEVIDSSGYSKDTSNDYKGALLTRVRSLTRGIHGQIFNGDIEKPNALFIENTIVDISRIGSSETKSLIMGILVLKLQEFRMSEKDKNPNSGLRHVTILEEAHNLLRRTSSEQSQESSNLQGKSVEMLANAIAEMRTYGEGFIISDQSPGLLDMSVIRNTNTKIILRLPDEGDRVLVGKAAGLTDAQITELSCLEVGVAAISQSDWLEPVLCKIDEFKNSDKKSLVDRYGKTEFEWCDDDNVSLRQFFNNAFDAEHIKLTQDIVDNVRKWCDTVVINDKAKTYVEVVLNGGTLTGEQKMILAAGITENRICKIPDRLSAISEVNKSLIGQFNFNDNDEIIRRISALFEEVQFPANIYINMLRSVKNQENGVK